jgi:hypothetical protein
MEIPAMKTSLGTGGLLISLLLANGVTGLAQSAATTTVAPRELTIVVVESLVRGPGRITDYDRINSVFTQVFESRKWPVTIKVERFAANTPEHDIELRVFYSGIYEETPGDLTFHAWMTLYDRGIKRDFGVVRFRYYPRAMELREDALERSVRGAAEVAADKIEAALFPKAERQKR